MFTTSSLILASTNFAVIISASNNAGEDHKLRKQCNKSPSLVDVSRSGVDDKNDKVNPKERSNLVRKLSVDGNLLSVPRQVKFADAKDSESSAKSKPEENQEKPTGTKISRQSQKSMDAKQRLFRFSSRRRRSSLKN